MRNTDFVLERHEYAPELTKLYLVRKKKWYEIDLDSDTKREMSQLKTYVELKDYVRSHIFEREEEPVKAIRFRIRNSLDRFPNKECEVKVPYGEEGYRQVMEKVEDYREKNEGKVYLYVEDCSRKEEFDNKVTIDRFGQYLPNKGKRRGVFNGRVHRIK